MQNGDPRWTADIRLIGFLLSLGSSEGANGCAVTAVDASISVDNVGGLTGGDSVNRTLIGASAASDAIGRNLVCHNKAPP